MDSGNCRKTRGIRTVSFKRPTQGCQVGGEVAGHWRKNIQTSRALGKLNDRVSTFQKRAVVLSCTSLANKRDSCCQKTSHVLLEPPLLLCWLLVSHCIPSKACAQPMARAIGCNKSETMFSCVGPFQRRFRISQCYVSVCAQAFNRSTSVLGHSGAEQRNNVRQPLFP